MSDADIVSRFNEEVLCNGPEAALPRNLSDAWLAEMQHSVECYFSALEKEKAEGEDDGLSLPLLAIIQILCAKNGGQVSEMALTEVFDCLEYYRLELALEDVRRKTDFQAEPATMETIFTNRDVALHRI